MFPKTSKVPHNLKKIKMQTTQKNGFLCEWKQLPRERACCDRARQHLRTRKGQITQVRFISARKCASLALDINLYRSFLARSIRRQGTGLFCSISALSFWITHWNSSGPESWRYRSAIVPGACSGHGAGPPTPGNTGTALLTTWRLLRTSRFPRSCSVRRFPPLFV